MKNYSKYLAGFLLAVSALSPMATFAQETGTSANPNNSPYTTTPGTAFCNRFGQFESWINQRTSISESRLKSIRDQISTTITTRRKGQNDRAAIRRASEDDRRAKIYTDLMSQAQSDEQKQAVEKFKTTVESAVVTLKQKVDAGVQDYRTGINNALVANKTAVDGAIANYKTAISATVEKAKSSCAASDADPVSIRATLLSDSQVNKTAFVSDLKAVDKVKNQVDSLLNTFKSTAQQAYSEFKTTVENARKELDQVLGR